MNERVNLESISLNEFCVNLELPNSLEMTLEIGKSKKKKFSSLKYKGNLIKKIETSSLPDYLNDGDILEVILQDNIIIKKDDNQQIVCLDGQIIDKNILVDVINDGNIIKIKFDDLILDEKGINYFGDLFTRVYTYRCEKRYAYKAYISGINKIKIVRYVNTHEHTEYSRLDGMTKIKELAKKCEYATAITDHGNMTGALKFDAAMRENGKKPIIGIEAYIEEIDDNIFNDIFVDIDEDYKKSHFKKEHIILIAKNDIGYKNLLKLASLSWNNFYGKNHITYRDLKKYSEGIIATSACLGSTMGKTFTEDEKAIKNAFFEELGIEKFKINNNIGEEFDILDDDDYKLTNSEKDFLLKTFNYTDDHLTKNDIEKLIEGKEKSFPKTIEEIKKYGYRARLYIEKMIELFSRDDFYIEIQRHKFFSEEHYESILLDLALEYNLKIVSGIDNHYLNKEDAPIHEMWLCESTKKNLDDPTRLKFPGEGYWLFSSDEALELYKDLPETLENSLEIADKCDVDLSHKGYELPKFPLPEGYGETKEEQIRYFKAKVLEGYKNRFLGTEKYNDPIYTNRMSFEINTILNMGFESYFLIVQDYISWAKDNNVANNLEKYFPKAHYNWDEIPDAIKNKTDEIYVGPGRGSAAGSLVAYCLGITNINPIDYDLLFERFLNPDRISMPK